MILSMEKRATLRDSHSDLGLFIFFSCCVVGYSFKKKHYNKITG